MSFAITGLAPAEFASLAGLTDDALAAHGFHGRIDTVGDSDRLGERH